MALALPPLDLFAYLAALLDQAVRQPLARQGATEAAAVSLLDPLDELIERGKSPGEIVLEQWQGEWAGAPDRLIDSTRY